MATDAMIPVHHSMDDAIAYFRVNKALFCCASRLWELQLMRQDVAIQA